MPRVPRPKPHIIANPSRCHEEVIHAANLQMTIVITISAEYFEPPPPPNQGMAASVACRLSRVLCPRLCPHVSTSLQPVPGSQTVTERHADTDTHSHTPTRTRPHTRPTTQGELCCQRGLLCTCGKVRESTKCYREGTIPRAKRIVLYFWEGQREHEVLLGGHDLAREGQFCGHRIVTYFWKGQRELQILAGSGIV